MKLSLSIGALYRGKFAIICHDYNYHHAIHRGCDVIKQRHTIQNLCSLEMDEKRVRAIIFDLDNTLIETRWAGEVAIQKVIM